MSNLEKYFAPFRENIIGYNKTIATPYGKKKIVYTDWIASGRLYKSIEQKISNDFGPLVGNTHSESSATGSIDDIRAYHEAHNIIKKHCNAGKDDVIITAGSGMTGLICKFQRLLGIKSSGTVKSITFKLPEELRPVVFVTHMEHHSNQTTWLETIADVVILDPDDRGLVDLNNLEVEVSKYKNRELKIGAFSSCSNVTGIESPYHKMAKIVHKYGGYCFIDFAASAPYVKIDMHPRRY